MHHSRHIVLGMIVVCILALPAAGKYTPVEHRTELKEGEIPVTEPGVCDQEGKTYVLMKDITSPTSGLFLANNVTLDLNGYTLTYAGGNYEHVTNYSFEDGLTGWDVSKAPGAKVRDTHMLHPMHGKMTCFLPAGQEIVSPYVNLPMANRTYFAMAMIAQHDRAITVSVDDEDAQPVKCTFKFGNTTRVTCPTVRGHTRLGGGVVYAMIYGRPGGKYRVRVKAEDKDVVIDAVDIRPAVDCGIGIVGSVNPWAYYRCVLDGDGPPGFFDYRKSGTVSTLMDTIPRVRKAGTVTIKNGVIKTGSRTIQTRGIQCIAPPRPDRNTPPPKIKTIIENVKIVCAGINANAVDALYGVMKDCHIEVDTPFIINRHTRAEVACRFSDQTHPSEISNCEFHGGQGCLTINGEGTIVHDNLFAGRQTVTNHYCLSLDTNNAKVYRNVFEPKQGSGIYLYHYRNNEIYDNVFKITAAPPNNEYSTSEYSTNAIRISDYNAKKGSARGTSGNRIYRNKFHITGRAYEGAHEKYRALANALFVSVGGGANYVYDNEIVIDQKDPANSKASQAYAFYIGGSDEGGVYYGNTITANVTPIWIANYYGRAGNVEMYDNTVTKSEGAEDFAPIVCGFYKHPTRNVGFYSNKFVGMDFDVKFNDYATKSSEYEFGWTLKINTTPGAEVAILDAEGKKIMAGTADSDGVAVARLAEYKVTRKGDAEEKIDTSTYTVQVGDKTRQVTMTADQEITLR